MRGDILFIYSPVDRVWQTEALPVSCLAIWHKDSPHHAANFASLDEVPVVEVAAAVAVVVAAVVDNTDT